MSCTSPWNWSTDSQPVQKPTSMAEYLANTIPRQQQSISASQWALLSNQNQNIQNLLVARGEGNAATRKIRHDLLKKKFESFHFLENETLNDITTRYYHLMSEMYYFGVLASQQEMVARFADALPPKWSPYIELLKHTGVLDAVNVNIYEFIQKLEHKNEEEIRKTKRIAPTQNTEMYLPGFGPSASSIQQPKLRTAFVSNTSSSPFPQFNQAQQQWNQSAYMSQFITQPQAQVSTTQPQFDPIVDCGPPIQLGNGDQTGTVFLAKIVKNVNDGESSGNDDSSGYSCSSDEESNLNERTDSEADNWSDDAKETKSQISDLIKKADATSNEMEKILTEDGSFSSQTAFMPNVTASTSQISCMCRC
ncbi:hypothetical protein HanPI659440_Chr06g0241291 [Helianthus annuus]|nr:hypothetical protein HanPI659440_Chr06g0241291 [Helianthus annuus]